MGILAVLGRQYYDCHVLLIPLLFALSATASSADCYPAQHLAAWLGAYAWIWWCSAHIALAHAHAQSQRVLCEAVQRWCCYLGRCQQPLLLTSWPCLCSFSCLPSVLYSMVNCLQACSQYTASSCPMYRSDELDGQTEHRVGGEHECS